MRDEASCQTVSVVLRPAGEEEEEEVEEEDAAENFFSPLFSVQCLVRPPIQSPRQSAEFLAEFPFFCCVRVDSGFFGAILVRVPCPHDWEMTSGKCFCSARVSFYMKVDSDRRMLLRTQRVTPTVDTCTFVRRGTPKIGTTTPVVSRRPRMAVDFVLPPPVKQYVPRFQVLSIGVLLKWPVPSGSRVSSDRAGRSLLPRLLLLTSGESRVELS